MIEDLFRDPLHLITLLAIVMLFFGGKRIADIGGSLGKGIRDFKREIRDDSDEATKAPASQVPTGAVTSRTCGSCGAPNGPTTRFCVNCGQSLSMPLSTARCPACDSEVASGTRFCSQCGHEVTSITPRSDEPVPGRT